MADKTYTGQVLLINDNGIHFTGEQEVYLADSGRDAADQAYYYHGLSGKATRGPSGMTVMFQSDGQRYGVAFTTRSDEEKREHREDLAHATRLIREGVLRDCS